MTQRQNRKLNLKARAERQAQTTRRIVEAAVSLHTTVGPARTTVRAIAERAGVQRQTVYAHFPTERSLFEACSAHGRAAAPPPDTAPWRAIADPQQRLRVALGDLYPYFRRHASAWAVILRDAEVMPLVHEMAARHRFGYLNELRDLLAAGWSASGSRHRRLLVVLGLAVDFRTWETLGLKQGLGDREAAELMAGVVACAIAQD